MEYFLKYSINSKKAKKKKKKQRRKIIWDNHDTFNLITSIIQLSVNGLNILINRC